MKAAIVMPLAEQRGGAELALWHLMQRGREAGVRWLVIFLEDGPMVSEVQSLGIATWVVRAGRLRELHRFLASVLQIARIVRRERASLILAWMSYAQLHGGLAAMLAGVPSLWYQHGVTSGGWMDRIATRLPARGVLACSKSAGDAQARLRPARPIRVVHPGVELQRFNPDALPDPRETRRRLGLPMKGPLIGIVGRLQRSKGMHVLVAAMPAVLQAHPDAHCVVVGGEHSLEPDYPSYLKEQITTLGLGDRVTLAGLQRNVPEWMQAMDVVVNASDREGFGLVVVEAMALRKPVISSAVGGPTEIITDGINGALVAYGDAPALTRSVLRYLDDPDLARRVGTAARERALEFGTESYARNLVGAVRESLGHIL